MRPRPETPHRTAAPLGTGHFVEAPGYAAWRPHGTADHLLILTLAGSGRFGHEGGTLVAGPGDIVLLRPGTPHDYHAGGAAGWELLWTHFVPLPHWLEWLAAWPHAAPGVGHLTLEGARGPVETALRTMHHFATGTALPRREQFALNALETALLWCDNANPRAGRDRLDERVARAMELLLARLNETIPMPTLADHVGLSGSRLAHLFRQHTGQTPQQFVERERIARAKQLLSLTTRPVAAIARAVGFDNPFYFSLRFKRATGLSPRDWRDKERQKPSAIQ